MKKVIRLLGTLLVFSLVVAGCSKAINDEQMPETSGVTSDMMEDDVEEDMMKDDVEEDMMEDDVEEDMMEDDVEVDMMEDDMMKNEGEIAPVFSLKDVNGDMVSLADFEGEKVYVKYWASWCSICLAGIDDVDTLSNNEDFKVITIVSPGFKGEKETEDFIKWWPSLNTENIVVLLDENGEYAQEYGVRGYPTSAYIGSDGVLVQVAPGHSSNENIIEKMSAIK